MTRKSTYWLDLDTIRTLDTLAQLWGVPKSEVVRRAIRMAVNEHPRTPSAALTALDQLQTSLRERNVDLTAWVRDLRTERGWLRNG